MEFEINAKRRRPVTLGVLQMKKILLAIAIFLFSSLTGYSSDKLKFASAFVINEGFSNGKFNYRIWFCVENISEAKLGIITGNMSPGLLHWEDRPKEISITVDNLNIDGKRVIPSRSDLRLVDIEPGEIAQIRINYQFREELHDVTISYQPYDYWNGRFAFWTGKLQSEKIMVLKNKVESGPRD